MTADHAAEESGPSTPSWLSRLNKVLSGEPQDREQLIDLLRDSEKRNLVDAQALAMIEGVLQVGELQVRDIMVPRAQMVVVNSDSHPDDFIASVTESGHSRFPVIGDSRDEVEGILLAKDLLGYYARSEAREFDMDDAMRPAVFIPESKRLNVLLREFRENRNHMAIVVDEYGGVAGLVTIEDVLEQIVGEIDDEHDTEDDSFIRRLGNGEYTVKAG
jgi:magnesium and cobalt transporter